MTNGLLLINLGTPKTPEPSAVRAYLKAFLSDKRVIDTPAFIRYFLLYGVILPFRPKQSAHAYKAIWQPEGSPLLIHSEKLLKKIQQQVHQDTKVALGMRYGAPSIETALDHLENCEHITILPLYPQYSSAATGSSIEKCLEILAKKTIIPSISIIRDFYREPEYIHAQAQLIQPFLETHDHLLLSYHGIPERQIKKSCANAICKQACPSPSTPNQACYRAQCYETTRLLAEDLKLNASQYSQAFQSRLGKTPWIKPYTDELLPDLAQKGIKRLLVACPSFVADCLETLEEIGIRAREQWIQLGGEQLTLVPCLNDHDDWVQAVLNISKISPT